MALRLCYLVVCRIFGLLGSRRRTALDKDIELMVLRHEVRVLQASAPWSRALPTHGPSDPRCAQPSAPTMALALLSRHARDAAALAPGALASQVETLASPARSWTSPARR